MNWSSCSAVLNSALGQFIRQTVVFGRCTGTSATHTTLCSLRHVQKRGEWGHSTRDFHVASVSCAGHNKWSKIKRKKAVTDLEKSKLRGKLIDKIRSAVNTGGPDTTTNLKLSGLLAQAKSMGLPKAVIEGALKAAAASSADVRESVLYEGRGPNGYLVLIEALTNNRKRTRPEIRHILEKQGGVLGEPGSSSFNFEHKGIVQVSLTEGDGANIDPLDLAIEVGAEDCSAEGEDDGNSVQLQCEPHDLNAVCNAVKAKGLTVSSASVEYLPKSYVALTEQQVDKAEKLVELLSEHNDVVGVHCNYELDSEQTQ